MEIRPLTIADAESWQAIRRRMLRDHPEAFGADADDFERKTLEEVEQRIARHAGPDSRMYGAFDDEALVGTIAYYFEGPRKRRHVRVIWGMYVASEVRGRGIGRALVEHALADIRKLDDVRRVVLEVSESNAGARRLYESCGFEAYGVEPDGLLIGERLEPTVLMNLALEG